MTRFTSKLIGSDTMQLHAVFILAIFALPGLLRAGSAAEEARFISNPRQLIYEGKRSGEGYFSNDGKTLIFQSEREAENPFYQIYLLDLESGDVRRVSPGVGKTTCGFLRPGGTEVIFASTHLDPKAMEKQRPNWIFAPRASNADIRGITTRAWIFSRRNATVAIAPSDEFARLRRGRLFFARRQTNRLYQPARAFPLEKLSAGRPKAFRDRSRLLWRNLSYECRWLGSAPADSRAGLRWRAVFLARWPAHHLAAFRCERDERRHLHHEDGWLDVRRVTDFKSISWAPFYHPSGEYVIFTSNKLGFSNFELFIVDAEGEREPIRVTFTDGFDGLPVFSPDGRKLSWASGRTEDGNPQIFIADWNHEAAQGELAQAPLRQAASR